VDLKGLSAVFSGIDSRKVIEARWKQCLDCTFLTKRTKTCRKCGCFMRIKVKLKDAKCPIGIW
jgi:hypothetical protein